MIDGKEVKRWLGTEEDHGHFIPIEKVEDWHRKHWLKSVEVMPVTDHDRIVAELRAEVERLTRGLIQIQRILKSRHLTDGQMCLAALSEAIWTVQNLAAIEKEGAKDE